MYDYDNEGQKRVVTLHYTPQAQAAASADQKVVDIFLLAHNTALQDHYHKFSTAKIIILAGGGIARVANDLIPYVAGSQLTFPCGITHGIRATAQSNVAFISFQDLPIIRPDGSADFFTVEDYKPLSI